MLKNLKIRTKLIAVLAAPLVVLVALAGLGIRDRLNSADDAQEVQRLAELRIASAELTHQVQLERNVTQAYANSAGEMEVAALTTQREATDDAVTAFNATAASVRGSTGSAGLVRQIDGAVSGLSSLTTAREAVDGAALAGSAPGQLYSNVIVAVSAIDGEISRSAGGSALAADLADLAALAQAKETTAQLAQLGATIVGSGVFEQTDRENLGELSQSAVNTINRVGETLGAQRRAAVRDAVNSDSTLAFNELIREINRTPNGGNVAVELTSYLDAANGTLNDWRGVETAIAEDISAAAAAERTAAQDSARNFAIAAAGAVVIAALLAWFVARSITRPLGRLTDAAYDLSNEKLPRLVEQLRSPNASAQSIGADIEAIDVRSSDEIGQLGEAFNAIQQVTVDVADEQAALLRRGISDIFVNLARRNQALLDRQIEFIDQLEANEEDPDQLENLFRLDHLATRMRRNAESLLVLAGAEPTRRRGRPVPLTDVVRVAIGEVEDFARISLLALDDVAVSGNVAVDLAHLLSELMENATQFSPPDTQVEIVGHRTKENSYVVSVSDQGIGMSAEQVAEANDLLANPPLVGLTLSRSLGFTVIGRLASRFDISVRLTSSPAGGVTALVTLPPSLIAGEGPNSPDAIDQGGADATPAAMELPQVAEAPVSPFEESPVAPVAEAPEVAGVAVRGVAVRSRGRDP